MITLRHLLLFGVLVVGVLGGSVERGTFASFTGSVTSAGNQFTAGSVALDTTIAVGDTLTVDNLVPGDSFSTQLNVSNLGTLDLRYAMTTSSIGSASLGTALQLTIRLKVGVSCAVTTGATLYTGSFVGAAIGNPAGGAQAGDRTLTAGNAEALCFTVVLPGGSSSLLEGTGILATFTFSAEQVPHN